MKTTWQQTTFDLHNLSVDFADNGVTVVGGIVLGVVSLKVRKGNVLIEIASVSGGHDTVDDGRSTSLVLSKTLVGRDEFLELLQTLVKSGILSRWGKV